MAGELKSYASRRFHFSSGGLLALFAARLIVTFVPGSDVSLISYTPNLVIVNNTWC